MVRIKIFENPATSKLDIYIETVHDGKPMVFAPSYPMEYAPFANMSPTASIPCRQLGAEVGRECLQELIDDLWNMGLRPKTFKATDAQVGAMQDHITDLRKSSDAMLSKILSSFQGVK